METVERLRCLFSARIEEQDGSYHIEVPEQEVRLGDVQRDETYRIAILPSSDETRADDGAERNRERGPPEPPVEAGETRDVEIEDIGEQGDGITRVERGFVVIVPDTKQGERVTIEITDVQENVAFADVVERLSYYE